MPTLPVPIFAALVLGFLCLRAWARGETPSVLVALIGVCALQSAVVAGRLHYGLPGLWAVQPVVALCVPPLAWVAFISTVRRPLGASDLWHLAAPAFGVFCVVFARDVLDQVIALVFFAYGAAIFWSLRRADEMAHARIGAGDSPRHLWRWIGAALIVSAMSDLAIAGLAAMGLQDWVPWLITGFSTLTLVGVGLLGLSPALEAVAEPEVAAEPAGPTEGDAALVQALEHLMQEKRLWLDPDLTLARIARRMAVPAKALSAAINRVKGENISRVVNAWRIAEACRQMRVGVTVTEAMLASGFNTKSNFNREFLRVMGRAPSDWLRDKLQDVVDKVADVAR